MAELALEQATIEYQEFGPQDSVHSRRCSSSTALRTASCGAASPTSRAVVDHCIVPTLPLGLIPLPVKDTGALSPHGVAGIVDDAIEALDCPT